MAHSLSQPPTALSLTTSNPNKSSLLPTSTLKIRASHQQYQDPKGVSAKSNADHNISRRNLSLVVAGTVLWLSGGEESARAAGRRGAPAAPTEKKDPNVSGVQAKVLASKRRKEAMKEQIAKLREKGKTTQPPPTPPPPASEENPSPTEEAVQP